MAESIRAEGIRSEHTKLALEAKNDREIKEVKEKGRTEIERLVAHNEAMKSELEKAYQLSIGTSKDEYEKKMTEVRTQNQKILEEEKAKGEEEVEKTRSRYQEQIARYKQNAEKQLEEMKRQVNNTESTIRRSAERNKS